MTYHLCQEENPPHSERRKMPPTCPLGDAALAELRVGIADLSQRLGKLQHSTMSYIAKQEGALEGFPLKDGKPDLVGHRDYHETLIEQAKARTAFWRKLTFELAKWGLLGFLGWAVFQLWVAFLHGPTK